MGDVTPDMEGLGQKISKAIYRYIFRGEKGRTCSWGVATHKDTNPRVERIYRLWPSHFDESLESKDSEPLRSLKPFTTDGCSGGMSRAWRMLTGAPPPWEGCCVEHDFAYWRGGTRRERAQADRALRNCVAASGHAGMSHFMWCAVRLGGHWIFPLPWRWGYGHAWPRPYVSEDKIDNHTTDEPLPRGFFNEETMKYEQGPLDKFPKSLREFKAWQKEQGIKPDGIYGNESHKTMWDYLKLFKDKLESADAKMMELSIRLDECVAGCRQPDDPGPAPQPTSAFRPAHFVAGFIFGAVATLTATGALF